MTSNIGARLITDKKTLGFTGVSEKDNKQDKEYVEEKSKKEYEEN